MHRVIPYGLLLLLNENSILLIKRQNTGFADGFYSLIGGKVEKDETFGHAVVREAFEEVGVTINEKDLQFAHVFQRKGTENELVAVVFASRIWIGEPFNKEPAKHSEITWFSIENLPENIVPAHMQALELIRQGRVYSEHNYE